MKVKFDRLSNHLIGWAYAFILTVLMSVILFQRVPLLEVMLFTVVAYILINLVFLNRLTISLFLSSCLLGALLITLVCWVETPLSKPVLYVVEGIIDMWYRITYNIPHNTPEMLLFARIFAGLTAVVASVLVILLYKKCFNFYLLTGITLAMALFSWYMTARESRWLFALFCVLTILSYIRHVYQKKKKLGLVPENLPLGHMMLYTIPLALLPVLVISFIPKKDTPLQWPWLDNKIMQAIEYFEQRYSTINADFFSLSSTGFSGNSQRLGGPVRPNNVIVMDVKASKRTYLRGAAYSWYENNAWAQTDNRQDYTLSDEVGEDNRETYTGWSFIPVDKMFASVSEEDKELLTNLSEGKLNDVLFPTYSLDIKYRNMTTRTVFMPLKSVMPIKKGDNSDLALIQDMNGTAVTDKKLPTGSEYHFDYIQPMYGEPMLKKALTFSRQGLYQEAASVLMSEVEELNNKMSAFLSNNAPSQQDNTDYSQLNNRKSEIILKLNDLNALIGRAALIEAEYTKLNENIPQRVKDLAADLTKDSKSDYEKVVSIENYLRNQFTYNLNARYIPEGEDFVDYFLFQDPQGYCTYFATSMTVLLRSLHIPARYVEGYVLPEEANDEDVYTITNKHAHAWVEVYFEGFGWLTFEPTAIYAEAMDYRVTSESLGAANYYSPTLEEIMERYRMDDDIPGYIPLEPIDYRPPFNFNQYLDKIPWILAGLVVLALMINLIFAAIGQLRMKWIKNSKKVIILYETMIKWLSHAGYEIKPGETIIEFSKRMDEFFIFPNTNFKDTAIIFVKVRYGGYEVSAEEIQAVEKLAQNLKKSVLKDIGVKRFIPLRYLIMGI